MASHQDSEEPQFIAEDDEDLSDDIEVSNHIT